LGFLDTLLGNDAADASKKAAADTYAKQTAASAGLRSAGDDFATRFGGLADRFKPYAATGDIANDALRNLLLDPSSLRSLPGYQFLQDEASKGVTRGGAATGNLFSGKTGKDLTRYATNIADQTYGNQFDRLMRGAGFGMDATGRGVATEGQGLQGQLGARTSAYGQDFNSAGTIGQGDIAAANAKAKGAGNLLNFGGSLLGTGLSGGFGGGGFGSLFGGGGGGVSGWDSYGGTTFPKVGGGWG
jgi:hypothetical protein